MFSSQSLYPLEHYSSKSFTHAPPKTKLVGAVLP